MSSTLVGARTPDWSGLPPELLQIIARKLPDISDVVNFRAVCTTWRSSARISDHRLQLPWFFEQRDSLEGDLRFYSLSSGKIHTVPSANSSRNWLIGPAHGYLFFYHETSHQISLLNPLTGRKVVLPFLDIVRPHLVWAGPDPIQRGDSVVLWGYSADFRTDVLALYQPVERKWTMIQDTYSLHCRDAYYNGMYFVNELNTGCTKVVNIVTREVVHVIPPPPKVENTECCSKLMTWVTYLVQSAGHILRVVLHGHRMLELNGCHFHIHRLDLGSENGGKPHWVKISSIGDQILFLDEDNGFSLSCRDFSGLRGNSIYFVKWRCQNICGSPFSLLCRYDIEAARAEPLTCPFAKGGTWIVPSFGSPKLQCYF